MRVRRETSEEVEEILVFGFGGDVFPGFLDQRRIGTPTHGATIEYSGQKKS